MSEQAGRSESVGRDPIRLGIAVGLVSYGVYTASFLPGMLAVPSTSGLFVAFLLQASLAVAAAFGVAFALGWAPAVVVLAGVAVAVTWLFEAFVLGIVAYLPALFAAVAALVVALAVASYSRSHLQGTEE